MANLKISGTTNEDARIKIMDDDVYIGYKDISAGAYQIVFPDQRPSINPDDDFTGTNGDPPDSTKWQVLSGSPEIQSNNVNAVHTAGIASNHTFRSRWVLTGDYHVRLKCDLTAIPHEHQNTAHNYSYLQILAFSLDEQNGWITQVYTQGSASRGHYIGRYSWTNGVINNEGVLYMGESWDDAGIGIKRVGSSYYLDRWVTSSWILGGVDMTGGYTGDVKITITAKTQSNFPGGTHVMEYFTAPVNETVVSGTWPVHVYGVSDSTNQTIGYANIPSIETSDPIDIIEYPY